LGREADQGGGRGATKDPGIPASAFGFGAGIFSSHLLFEVPSNPALERSPTVAQRCNTRAEGLRHAEK